MPSVDLPETEPCENRGLERDAMVAEGMSDLHFNMRARAYFRRIGGTSEEPDWPEWNHQRR